jgi:hypothetical protein
MDQHETHIPAEEARSGETSGRMRIVLIVSTALAVLALGLVLAGWVIGGG